MKGIKSVENFTIRRCERLQVNLRTKRKHDLVCNHNWIYYKNKKERGNEKIIYYIYNSN